MRRGWPRAGYNQECNRAAAKFHGFLLAILLVMGFLGWLGTVGLNVDPRAVVPATWVQLLTYLLGGVLVIVTLAFYYTLMYCFLKNLFGKLNRKTREQA